MIQKKRAQRREKKEVRIIPVEGQQQKTYLFKVVVERDAFEDGREAWTAYCPGLKGTTTWGETYEQALKNAQEVIQIVIESMVEHGEPIPVNLDQGVIVADQPLVVVKV
jgi:predicted RNase H-like HicB family nuclease